MPQTPEKRRSEAVKAWLQQYGDAEHEISLQEQRLDNLDQKMTSVASPVMDGMPKAHEPAGDKIGRLIAQKDALERELQKMIRAQERRRKKYMRIINRLPAADERAVIQMRYIDGMRWDDVNVQVFGAYENFLEHEASYLRRLMKIHSRALQHLADLLERDGILEISP